MKKKSLNERLEEQERARNRLPDRSALRGRRGRTGDEHSAAFRRHFKDYVEFADKDENGRRVIRRVYQGIWYIPEIDREKQKREQLLLVLLYLLGLALFLVAATRQVPANRLWYMGTAQFFTAATAIYTATGLFNYLTGGPRLTEHDHDSGPRRLRLASLVTAAILALSAVLYLVCAFTYRVFAARLILCAVLSLAAALAFFALNRVDSRIAYRKEQSTEPAPADAVPIE